VILKKTSFGYLSSQAGMFAKLGSIFVVLGIISLMINPFVGLLLVAASSAFWNKWLSYMKGIQGEKKTSRALRDLDDDYFLLDDVQLYSNSGNIDHVILGPSGIFAIESKNYSGIIRSYGDTWYRASGPGRKSYEIASVSTQAKNNAKNLYKFLQRHLSSSFGRIPFITPLVAFTNSSMDLQSHNPTVEIVFHRKICGRIKNYEPDYRLSTSDLKRIGEAILSNSVVE